MHTTDNVEEREISIIKYELRHKHQIDSKQNDIRMTLNDHLGIPPYSLKVQTKWSVFGLSREIPLTCHWLSNAGLWSYGRIRHLAGEQNHPASLTKQSKHYNIKNSISMK